MTTYPLESGSQFTPASVGEIPYGLRAEHLDEALGIRVARPRLSWRLPHGTAAQRAYRISADNGWDTGRVPDDRSVLVPYAGPPLSSGQRVTWRVKVWTDLGESGWSAPCWFEMGLLETEDWQAEWIEPAVAGAGRPAPLLRYEFTVDRRIATARLHVTAHGLYEGFLNGARIGDAELTPGFTQYDARLQVQTYDVTADIRTGRNAIGAVLADGWYRGQIGITRAADQWGSRLGLLARLVLTYVLWQLDGAEIEVRVDVPAGTSAEVVLPDGRVRPAAPGTHTFR
jgi:alpha-L-rhamnosidase